MKILCSYVHSEGDYGTSGAYSEIPTEKLLELGSVKNFIMYREDNSSSVIHFNLHSSKAYECNVVECWMQRYPSRKGTVVCFVQE